jgi:hypothetical protein
MVFHVLAEQIGDEDANHHTGDEGGDLFSLACRVGMDRDVRIYQPLATIWR